MLPTIIKHSPILNVMFNAATKAAKGLVRDFGEVEQLQVSRKGPGDFVSAADLRAEKILKEELQKARPSFGFLLEEGGEIVGEDSECRWIIDPLDGTTNFLHGIPHFAISIALEKNREIIAGLIYDPIKSELFVAEKGRGAFMNEKRLRVSARNHLSEALLGTGIMAGYTKDHEIFIEIMKKVLPVCSGIRRLGVASLDLTYVASGRMDAYFELSLKPWDMAAGILIMQEAGGFITDIQGKKIDIYDGNILASNTHIHTPLLKVLSDVLDKNK